MLEALGNHSQSQCLHLRHGFITVVAVAQHAGQSGNFGEPSISRSSSIVKVRGAMYHPGLAFTKQAVAASERACRGFVGELQGLSTNQGNHRRHSPGSAMNSNIASSGSIT